MNAATDKRYAPFCGECGALRRKSPAKTAIIARSPPSRPRNRDRNAPGAPDERPGSTRERLRSHAKTTPVASSGDSSREQRRLQSRAKATGVAGKSDWSRERGRPESRIRATGVAKGLHREGRHGASQRKRKAPRSGGSAVPGRWVGRYGQRSYFARSSAASARRMNSAR